MIKPDDLVEDVVSRYPQTVRIFMTHNFPCLVCGEPVWGTIEENALRNGLSRTSISALMNDLNDTIGESV